MAELISHEPLKEDSHVSESELSALQAMEEEANVREAVSARTDASRRQRVVHQEDGPCAWEAAQHALLHAGTLPLLSGEYAYDLRPTPFCFSFPPGSRPLSRYFPYVLHPPVVHY